MWFFSTKMSICRPIRINWRIFLAYFSCHCRRLVHNIWFLLFHFDLFAIQFFFCVLPEQKTLNRMPTHSPERNTETRKKTKIERDNITLPSKNLMHKNNNYNKEKKKREREKISVHYFNFQVIIHFKCTRLICTYKCKQRQSDWTVVVNKRASAYSQRNCPNEWRREHTRRKRDSAAKEIEFAKWNKIATTTRYQHYIRILMSKEHINFLFCSLVSRDHKIH